MNVFYQQFSGLTNSNLTLNLVDPLQTIREEYKYCRMCSNRKCRVDNRGIVFGKGTIRPKLMFIGDAPSNYDAEVGAPFADVQGQRINGMVEYITRQTDLRNNVYFTNTILCPGGLNPEAVKACRDRLYEEIKIVNPRVIVLLGPQVVSALDGMFAQGQKKIRGRELILKVDKYYTGVITHSLIDLSFRREEVKYEVKDDLDFIIKVLRGQTTDIT